MTLILTLVLPPLIYFLLYRFIALLLKLYCWQARRYIHPGEDQLVPLDEITHMEDRQVMIDRVRKIFSGFMGDYYLRIPYYQLCGNSLILLILMVLFFFLFRDLVIEMPWVLAYVYIMPVVFLINEVRSYLAASKITDSILYGSWFDKKSDKDVLNYLYGIINSHNEIVEAKRRKNKPAPFLLKHTGSVVICLSVLCVAFCLHCLFGEEPGFLREINYQYTVSDGSATITGYKGLWFRLHIPSNLGGVPVTAVGEKAMYNRENIYAVRFEEGIRQIGESAFGNCSKLKDVILPESLEDIGNASFALCDALTDIKLPEGLKRIGERAFYSSDLRQIRFPSGIESIGSQAFDCRNLETAVFPDTPISLTVNPFGTRGLIEPELVISPEHPTLALRDGALYNKTCAMLLYMPPSLVGTQCRIPAGTEAIGGYAFYGYSDLKSVYLPEGLTDIGACAFANCKSLEEITLPDGLRSIGEEAFSNCDALARISAAPGPLVIGNRAFSSCNSLTEVQLPEGLTDMGEGVFYYCDALKRVSTAPGPLVIGKQAFVACKSLTDVILAEGLTSIGEEAFKSCVALKKIVLPEGLTDIGRCAFSYCSALEDLTLPDSLLTVGEHMLEYCKALKSLVIPPRVTSLPLIFDYMLLAEGILIEALTIPPQVTFIAERLAATIPRDACITVAKGSCADTWLKDYPGRFTVQYADFPE